MIFVSIRQSNIPSADLNLPQFLVVISKIIFALSSQERILTLFIPVLFACLCITFHLSKMKIIRVVQNFRTLISRI